MNGLEFLKQLMPQYPLPVIIVSSHSERGAQVTLDALFAGAVDYVTKPKAKMYTCIGEIVLELKTKIKIASTVDVSSLKKSEDLLSRKTDRFYSQKVPDKVIAIGASTGGTEAIKKVISGFPKNFPGVLIVQHMPEKFTASFAKRMNLLCEMEVKEAEDGDEVRAGRILIAPGGFQMALAGNGIKKNVRVYKGEKVSGHAPSVDVMMSSVARVMGKMAMGILLTGMGADGAEAMLELHNNGAVTFAQDEATSVVYGMPAKAIANGSVDMVVPIHKMADAIINELYRVP
jgi:two-component system chemotaxis response regulator CheB